MAAAKKQGVYGWQSAFNLPAHMLLNDVPMVGEPDYESHYPDEIKALLENDEWMLQPKWDGKRAHVGKLGSEVGAIARSGEILEIDSAIVEDLRSRFDQDVVLDAEVIGTKGQQACVVFDVLQDGLNGVPTCAYLPVGLAGIWQGEARYRAEHVIKMFQGTRKTVVMPSVTAFSKSAKQHMYQRLLEKGTEGAVFKKVDEPYSAGRPNVGGPALRYKFLSVAILISGGQVKEVSKRTGKPKRAVTLLTADGAECGEMAVPPNQEIPAALCRINVRYLYRHDVGGDLLQAVYLGPAEAQQPTKLDNLRVKGQPRK